uniref:Cytochrome n=1 Tax=Plectus sambesii TaxID=2011161 RepID=A0A914X5W4_9BILA
VNKGLTAIDDQHWKDVRSTITPAFTTGKIKHMTTFLDDSLATLDDIISEYIESGKPIPVKEVLGCFALDVIAKSAFGMDIDAQRDKHSPFVKHATEIFSIKLTNYRIALGLMFPQLMRSLQNVFKFQLIFPEGDRFYKCALRAIIAEREKQEKPKLDFLQLLLNATKQEKSDPVEADKELVHDKAVGGKTVKLDEYDLMAQCFTFIVAGYETTSTTLQFALYLLTVHPEVQDKCYEQIASVVDETSHLNYDRLQQLTYLEKVISETLRMYTPSQRTERECNSAIEINGISIEKGVIICVPIWAIHHDPEIYPEPDKFDPERFSPENKVSRDPLAYMPFGHGPRNCIGMRFAQLEMKMALAYLLHRFKFIPCAETESMPLKVKAGFSTMPVKPIFLSAVKR